jgi:hypothetical protein
MAFVLTRARAGAPVAMGALYTWTGAYTAVFVVLILTSTLAAVTLFALGNPPQQIY